MKPISRRITKEVRIGNVTIGGDNKIAIQSMCNTQGVEETIQQIHELEDMGCEIIRIAIPNMETAKEINRIKNKIHIPLVADIHFDYRLALAAIENGADKLRINPGNIGDKSRIKEVVVKASKYKIPIRIGVNSGSLEKDILEKYNGVTAEGLVESASRHISILEDLDFTNIVVAMKSSSVPLSFEAYRLLSEKVNYPLHIGITEAGTLRSGQIKSSIGIGALLLNGIGDTLRVSLTSSPIEEVICAKEILKSLEIRQFGINFITCPTCGRTEIDLIGLAQKAEDLCKNMNKNIKVAIMGCAVNGPGEAREADIGIAGGKGCGLVFKKGEIVRKVKEEELLSELIKEIERYQTALG